MSYSHTEWSVQCDVYVDVSPCHKAHNILTLSFHPRRSVTRTLTVIHDCHPAVRLSSSTILLFGQPYLVFSSLLVSTFQLPIMVSSFGFTIEAFGFLGFLSALTQMRHPATVGPRRFTDVDRDLNVFRFVIVLFFFTGVGY